MKYLKFYSFLLMLTVASAAFGCDCGCDDDKMADSTGSSAIVEQASDVL